MPVGMGKRGGRRGRWERLTRVRVEVDETVRIVDVRVRGDGVEDAAAAEEEREGEVDEMGEDDAAAAEERDGEGEEGEAEGREEGDAEGIGEGDIEAESKPENSDSVVVV